MTAPTDDSRERGASLTHTMPLRVYYEDTDAGGIVYHANFLKFAERARTEMMRALGFEHSGIEAETGIVFTVRQVSADFRLPARLDDLLSIETRIVEIGGARLLLDQRVCRDGAVLAALDIVVACLGRGGRPRRIPPALRTALASADHSSVPPSIVAKTP
ncbi:MAG TPA: tol-pal system-associated acyl-CoA thioesterase [Stellaceae bacterium]|nr:tol-pal system-associated acyl-CoA thioesterase [Stellaceae bacterium]